MTPEFLPVEVAESITVEPMLYGADDSLTPEERFWRRIGLEVIAQAFEDARGINLGVNTYSKKVRALIKSDARRWLISDSACFRCICQLAHVTPQSVNARAKKVLGNPYGRVSHTELSLTLARYWTNRTPQAHCLCGLPKSFLDRLTGDAPVRRVSKGRTAAGVDEYRGLVRRRTRAHVGRDVRREDNVRQE